MFLISLQNENRVLNIFDSTKYIDEGVQLFPITEDEKNQLNIHCKNGDFKYENGVLIFDPIPETYSKEEINNFRQIAYQTEADPLFFKFQRGEGTEQEWLDKIAEIRLRYPDPV